jgi:hypothetical protein
MRLLLNAAQCTHCKDYLVSKHRHDFTRCSCDALNIDGGTDYVRVTGFGYKNLSIYEEETNHFLRRECIFWGVNYTKEMIRLPETEWRVIKDLETSHIKAILKTQSINEFLVEVFYEELEWRKLYDK